jgi:hypothetical protein
MKLVRKAIRNYNPEIQCDSVYRKHINHEGHEGGGRKSNGRERGLTEVEKFDAIFRVENCEDLIHGLSFSKAGIPP